MQIGQRNEIVPDWRAQGDRGTLIWEHVRGAFSWGTQDGEIRPTSFHPNTLQKEILRVTHFGAYAKVGVEPGAAMVAPPTKGAAAHRKRSFLAGRMACCFLHVHELKDEHREMRHQVCSWWSDRRGVGVSDWVWRTAETFKGSRRGLTRYCGASAI